MAVGTTKEDFQKNHVKSLEEIPQAGSIPTRNKCQSKDEIEKSIGFFNRNSPFHSQMTISPFYL